MVNCDQNGFEYVFPEGYELEGNTKKAYYELTVKKKPVVFLTGRAGTGKTTFIHYLKKNFKGNSVILTPTGMTAVNIGGQTIHSFFRFPPRLFDDSEIKPFYNKAIKYLELIIIDEISMVQSDILDHIDFALRKWRGSDKPFAGIQMLLVGDCFQLSPWIKYGVGLEIFREKYRSQWFFDAHVLEKIDIEPINLTEIYRQQDKHFTNLLNKIRIKHRHYESAVSEINDCCCHNSNMKPEDDLILATTNSRAEFVNLNKLGLIKALSRVYYAHKIDKITDDIKKTIPEKLELKVNAQVMVTKNIKDAANGTLGVVKKMLDNKIIIEKLDSKQEIECSVETWEQFQYEWDSTAKRVSSKKIGEYKQIPLRLGWAVTIHKSQGLTFDSIKIDLTGGAFSPGQTYVALSRCRTLEKITLVKPILLDDIKVDQNVMEFYSMLFL